MSTHTDSHTGDKSGAVTMPGEFDLDLDREDKAAVAKKSTNETLDLAKKGPQVITSMKTECDKLLPLYTPGTEKQLLTQISNMFTDMFTEFRRKAGELLDGVLEQLKTAELPPEVDLEAETANLKGALKSLVMKRLDLIEATRAKAATAKKEARRLLVGIVGNPELKVPVATQGWNKFLLPITIGCVAAFFELGPNLGVLQNESDRNTALTFGLAVVFIGTPLGYAAGLLTRQLLNNMNAEAAKRASFPNGMDPETKEEAKVFPLPGDFKFKLYLVLGLFGTMLVSIALIRWYLGTQKGDIAGTFVVLFSLIALYTVEAIYGEVEHEFAGRYHATVKEIEEAEETLKTLESSSTSGNIKQEFDSYVFRVTDLERTAQKIADTRKRIANNFLRLVTEVAAAPSWFNNQYSDVVEYTVKKLPGRTESDSNMAAWTTELKPAFAITELPFDIKAETERASGITSEVTTKGKRVTVAEFDKLVADANAEVVNERNAARKQVEQAALETAKSTAKPMESTWKAPRF